MNKKEGKFDLENRTVKFNEDIIVFARILEKDIVTVPLIKQLIRSATSIGANYCEANGASSKRDFKSKIYICKKEAKETIYWLQSIAKAIPDDVNECRKYWKEARELTMIFSRIIFTMNAKGKN